jgi:hypothetical protein
MMKITLKELMVIKSENTPPSSKMLPVKLKITNIEKTSLDILSLDSEEPKLKLKQPELPQAPLEFTKLIMKDLFPPKLDFLMDNLTMTLLFQENIDSIWM